MSDKARRLSARLSIDPDAEDPMPASRPTPVPVEPAAAMAAEPSAAEERPTRVTPVTRVTSAGPAAGETCLDDPEIKEGKRRYRSQYVRDTAFARFRSAIFWCSRRDDAAEVTLTFDMQVPWNMSTAVDGFMEQVAEQLEQAFNEGRPFPPTLEQRAKMRGR